MASTPRRRSAAQPKGAKPAAPATKKPATKKAKAKIKQSLDAQSADSQGDAAATTKHLLSAEAAKDADTLHPRVRAFADEYLRDLNGTAAYLRIHPTASVRTAGTESWRLLKNPEVRSYIAARRQRIAVSVDFTRDDWLREQIAVVRADPAELTQMRCVACADCWPKEREPETPEAATKPRDDENGRLRFDDWLEPDPECSTCHGEGSPRVWFADTRKLSPEAKALFLSAYRTKDGMRVELRDKDAALERLGRALGVYELDNAQKGKSAAEAMREFFAEVTGGGLQVVRRTE